MPKFEITLTGVPDFSQVARDLNEQLPQLLEQEMLNTRARLIADTVAGTTADGGGLKPYSRSYIEAIDSGSVPGKSPGNHTPNLTATGQLLRSFMIEAQGLVVRMFFSGTHSRPSRTTDKTAKRKRQAAEKSGHELQSRANRPVGAARALGGGGKKLGGSKKQSATDLAEMHRKGIPFSRGGGGGDVQNAVIAQGQYDMGRTGWVALAQADIDRTVKAAGDLAQKILASIKK